MTRARNMVRGAGRNRTGTDHPEAGPAFAQRWLFLRGGGLRQHDLDFIVRARNHLHADDFADGARRLGAGVRGGLDGGDIAGDDGGHERVADLFDGTDQRDVGRLEHGVSAGDEGGEAPGFEESDGFGHRMMGVGGCGGCENQLRAARQRSVSRATTSSSLAGMTSTFVREAGAEISPSAPRSASFFAGSSTMPSWSRSRRIAARRSGLFSPMPAVKTIASQPPSSKCKAPSQCRAEWTSTSSASRARALPCAAAARISRRSLPTPESPSSPLSFVIWRSISASGRPSVLSIYGTAAESRSPTRLFCGRPDCGLSPMLVPMARPSRMPVMELLPPRWQEMTRSPGWPGFTGRGAGLVKAADALGDVVPAQQLGRALGDELVAGPVETVAPHARLIPRFGHGVARRGLGHPLVEGGFKERDQRHAGQLLLKTPDAGGIGRVVRGRDLLEALERGNHPLVGGDAAGEIAAQHRLEADAVQIGGGLDVARGLELREAVVDRLAVIRDPFVAALGQQRRPRSVEAEEAELEGGRAKVGDEDVHGRRQVAGETRRRFAVRRRRRPDAISSRAGDPAAKLGEFLVRARDDLHGDHFADRGGGLGAGVDGGLHRGDVAAEERGHVAAADRLVAGHGDVGGLEGGIRGLEQRAETLRFNHA